MLGLSDYRPVLLPFLWHYILSQAELLHPYTCDLGHQRPMTKVNHLYFTLSCEHISDGYGDLMCISRQKLLRFLNIFLSLQLPLEFSFSFVLFQTYPTDNQTYLLVILLLFIFL